MKLESGSTYFSFNRWNQARSTWGQPGVNLGSTWGQPGVNLGSTWGQPGVNLHRRTMLLVRADAPLADQVPRDDGAVARRGHHVVAAQVEIESKV